MFVPDPLYCDNVIVVINDFIHGLKLFIEVISYIAGFFQAITSHSTHEYEYIAVSLLLLRTYHVNQD